MRWGDFRQYFRGYAWKRLTPHEVDPAVSNGHEFQGVNRLREILGSDSGERIPTTYMLLADSEEDSKVLRSWSRWYDSRRNQAHRGPEYRLYYPSEAGVIQSTMSAGDLMVVAATRSGELLIMLAQAGGSRERELQTLFDLGTGGLLRFDVRVVDRDAPIDYLSALILEQLGIEVEPEASASGSEIVGGLVDRLVASHAESLPAGAIVSRLVRDVVTGVDPVADPDGALYRWIEVEDATFRSWEDQRIAVRLRHGFMGPNDIPDVVGFREFAMTLRQSRVSRAGSALQNHFAALLDEWRVRYAAQAKIDGGERPDFLFPSKDAYENLAFPADKLRMVGAKFTAKDRWRQILNEAARIPRKHMLTMDSAISRTQLALMTTAQLTLIVPTLIRDRYPADQAQVLTSVAEFLHQVSRTQED